MDLMGMLNDVPPPPVKKTPVQIQQEEQTKQDKKTLLTLGTTLKYILSKDEKLRRDQPDMQRSDGLFDPEASLFRNVEPQVPKAPDASPLPSCPRLTPELMENPSVWKPKLSLNLVAKGRAPFPFGQTTQRRPIMATDQSIQLVTHEVIHRGREPRLLLEDTYEIQGAYPRGFFVLMAKRSVDHNFVFSYPNHPWFEDLYGLRQSAYIIMRAEDGTSWELHLKPSRPSRDKMWLFGYLIKHTDMIRIVRESMSELLFQRKLPLVLDLDDTLVRLVGEGNERYVPERDLPKCGDRVAVLRDGKRVVLAEHVREFLEWAQAFYEISVCSLGDQNYVDNVVNVLDPQRTRICGILYSARSEHDYIKRSADASRPPKDLLALYAFCALSDKSVGSAYSLPLIVDDETRMWPSEQHDNIIVVTQQDNKNVWSVSLFPTVTETLRFIHTEFFRQFDIWYTRQKEAEQQGIMNYREPPSATTIYKTLLRNMLRDQIAKGPPSGTPLPPSTST